MYIDGILVGSMLIMMGILTSWNIYLTNKMHVIEDRSSEKSILFDILVKKLDIRIPKKVVKKVAR